MSTGTEPRRLGRYELQERLGRGGMAEVWKALDTQLQRYVAIKVLHPNLRTDPNFTSRFEREAQLIAALHHPNIVQIYDFQVTGKGDEGSGIGTTESSNRAKDTDDDEPAAYMIMNYVEGPTLAQYLHATVQQGKFLSDDELLQLFNPICQGIDYAHKRGMVHRDLKPANILLDEQNKENNPAGEPIISDFGISKMLNDQTQTQHGFWLGTPAYIAPEQVQGERTTAQSDIYALAIILYETCTGTLPFQADGPIALAMQHVNGTPTSPDLINPNISPALANVIMHGLEKDPTDRYATASALLKALKDALKGTEITNATEDDNYATSVAVNEPDEADAPDAPDAPTYLIPQVHAQTANPSTPAKEQPVATEDAPTVITAPRTESPKESKAESQRRKRRPLLIGLVCLIIAAFVGGTFLVLPRFITPAPAPAQADAGTLNFLNSGQYNQDGSAGITDQVQVDFTTLAAPDAGKAYYAWLLTDARNQNQQSLSLGKLAVSNGKGQIVFNGDEKHSNLLALYSRFVLTMESATAPPTQPGPKSSWRYYGEIPNIPIPSDTISHYSLLDHMRHLTSDDPILNAIGLHGGLNLWFGRNAGKLLEATSNARDETNMPLLHRQIVRSLDYLDGQIYSRVDVPAGTQFLIDPLSGQVGLLTFNAEQPLPGLLTHIQKHLTGLAEAPGVLDGQVKLANQLSQETQMVEKGLASARDDAKKLVVMDDTQLSQPEAHTLLNDLYQQVNSAYVGQRDPATGELRGGVEQISAQILHLSMINIKSYKQA